MVAELTAVAEHIVEYTVKHYSAQRTEEQLKTQTMFKAKLLSV
jgi:hypothetical protein